MIQIKKTILTLALLLTAVGGAWADETPLVTIESKDYTSFTSGNKTFDDKVTVTFSNSVLNSGNTYGWFATSPALLTVAGTNGYTITSCKFYTEAGVAATGYTVEGESPSVYLSGMKVYNDANQSVKLGTAGVTKIEVFGAAASASSSFEVAWNAESKTGSFTMPGGNVTLEPEYYPQATLAFKGLTAAEDAAAKTEAPLAVLADGAVTGGTLMYYVATDKNFSQADAIALAETQWSAAIPTAETIEAAGTYIMWYYIKGDDEHSDTDPQLLQVTVLPEPTYAVELAEGTEESDKWTVKAGTDGSFQSLPLKGVKAGMKVKLKYDGDRSMLKAVKAEKKAAAPTYRLLSAATAEDVGKIAGKDGKIYATKADAEAVATGNAVAMIAYVGTASDCAHGLAIALADESGTKEYGAAGTACSGKAAVTGGTWRLPSIKDWQYMFIGCGASGSYSGNPSSMSYSGLASKLTTAQGDALQTVEYWSSTESSPGSTAWVVKFDGSNASFNYKPEFFTYRVRACLAF